MESGRRRNCGKVKNASERFKKILLIDLRSLKPFYNDVGEIVDFTYIYQNARAAQTAGRSPEDLAGHRMTEIYSIFPQTRFFTIYKQVAETGQTAGI